jgi:hypothetical protein
VGHRKGRWRRPEEEPEGAAGIAEWRPFLGGQAWPVAVAAALLCAAWLARAQEKPDAPKGPVFAKETVTVSADHPRLFLRPQRLRLLRRERERASERWRQFEALIKGNAPMPERGFSLALYSQVAKDEGACKDAAAWALGQAADLRQMAIVFDWCQDLLTPAQRRELTDRLQKAISAAPGDGTVDTVRSRVLAAIVLFDHVPDAPQRELERVVHEWWEGKTVPALRAGRSAITRDDAYPLYELLHAIRDNANLDLRESFPQFFKDYPIEHLMSYYPLPYDGPENAYFIGLSQKAGNPDLRAAALSRAAELAIVAFDVNAPETQVLQGWLMHDRYILRGTLGAPYEFLWANPYQPGLSYYHVPLVYHNPEMGKLFVRSSWDDTARWLGYWDGVLQIFDEGKIKALDPKRILAPISMTEAIVVGTTKFQVTLDEEQAVFVLGLTPGRIYQIEIDEEEMYEAAADKGGMLALDPPHGKPVGIRIKEAPGS